MATESGWACKKDIDQWHVIEGPVEPGEYWPVTGVSLCGVTVSRADGDSLDFSAHPRIGTRCVECESQRVDRWCSWLDDC